ncbi:MAG TPA: hypothetical protein VMX54_00115 [Vicinamibacteria bacterium]|nr:hypothetical protein [Vicinamibacteria bacterium]
MSARRLLATALVSCLGCSGLPLAAWAEPAAPARGLSPLRASVDRAVGAAPLPQAKKAGGVRMTTTADGGGGGGGGGHAVLVVLGLAASAATAYFVVKETKKQTGQTQ